LRNLWRSDWSRAQEVIAQRLFKVSHELAQNWRVLPGNDWFRVGDWSKFRFGGANVFLGVWQLGRFRYGAGHEVVA
jgi:hypothetical protein